ncbi:hypothetical protein POF45_22020 [Pseudomonas sp. 681]|uniref:Uncharacterized protein n=1 Tax=Pseudomonas fungipugnans TaxID=3024217 RepID=A0ABT6QT75_9PSED|nr:hypothetical protein [Pseudomonas sp. 681]MDI2594085.1 hypothetical protein [Pseudomonas sp. 681]
MSAITKSTPASKRKPVPRSKRPLPKSKRAPEPSMTRDDLSFTARIHNEIDPQYPRLVNWAPVEIPHQKDQWNIGRDMGLKMMDELARLADVDEPEAFNAIRFAPDSRNWVGERGTESGFSEGIAALAIVGLRYLARGAQSFDPENPQPSVYWTAKRLLDSQIEDASSAPPALVALKDGRAQGCAAALLNVGLIDQETYSTGFIDRSSEKSRSAK